MEPSNTADSAGQAWAGRSLHGPDFGNDDGSADPQLLAALEDVSAETEWMAALSAARLIVPIVAAPGEVDDSGDHPVEKSTEMAVVTLTAPDGKRALPVFTGVEALQRWDPSARPSPVRSSLAAQAAISEQCDVMVLDLSSPQSVVLRSSMVWALAQQHTWLPAHADDFVRKSVSRAAAEEPDIVETRCEAGDVAGVLKVVLCLRDGLTSEQVQSVATRVGERIATDGEARARIDAIAFSIRGA